MLNAKENFLATIQKDGKPDRLVKQWEGLVFYPPSPVSTYERGVRSRGMAPLKDRFGTTILWPEDQFAAMPHVTAEDKVIPDISHWEDYLDIPDLVANCSDPELWKPMQEHIATINRDENLYMGFMPTGVFERLHFLTGFEDLFLGMTQHKQKTLELANAIGEYRFQFAKLIVDNLHPDVIMSHDDWGAKTSLFISPKMWRTYIKPQYEKTYKYMKDNGVIVIHHADSFLEPVIDDMVELGVDVWQGALPQNDILKIQKQVDGRMTLMGGIDAAIVDRKDATEEEIRKETHRACMEYGPGGHFIPCITYGGPGAIYDHVDAFVNDEIDKCNAELFKS